MVTSLNIRNFYNSTIYNELFVQFLEKTKSFKNIHFRDEDSSQVFNIFAKSINNANLNIADLEKIIVKNKLFIIQYTINEISLDFNANFYEGYNDRDNDDEIIESYYSKTILIPNAIKFHFLHEKTSKELEYFLRKERMPNLKKYIKHLYSLYEKTIIDMKNSTMP